MEDVTGGVNGLAVRSQTDLRTTVSGRSRSDQEATNNPAWIIEAGTLNPLGSMEG